MGIYVLDDIYKRCTVFMIIAQFPYEGESKKRRDFTNGNRQKMFLFIACKKCLDFLSI